VRKELQQAAADAQKALDTKSNIEEMSAKLTDLLERFESLPEHYLVEDVQPARKFLDKLAPIPAIREHLVEALADGKEAFSSVSLFRDKEAIMCLHVAVAKATKFYFGSPTEQAAETLDNLVVLKEALVDLNSAIFTGKSVSAPGLDQNSVLCSEIVVGCSVFCSESKRVRDSMLVRI